jgi:formylglycine-generating enzyme
VRKNGAVNQIVTEARKVNPIIMKTKFCFLFIAMVLLVSVHPIAAQVTKFFRISGPAATTIIAIRPDGSLVWNNTLTGTNYTIQTASSLTGVSNWVDYVQVFVTNSVNTNLLIALNPPDGMAFVPAGSFIMGNDVDFESFTTDERPAVTVNVSAFYMDTNLVSYSQWQSVYNYATNQGYGFVHAGAGKAANHPVQTVDWYDAAKWCNARSQLAGLTPVYYGDAGFTQVYTNGEVAPFVNWTNSGYRLPTEAEWEKAARGGLSRLLFPWGNTISESQANYGSSPNSYDLGPAGYNPSFTNGGAPYTSPVGYFAPNNYGLCDMAGNVFEWCWDWYATGPGSGDDYVANSTDPRGSSTGGGRIIRGGAWAYVAFDQRCAYRLNALPANSGFDIGFRCVRAP